MLTSASVSRRVRQCDGLIVQLAHIALSSRHSAVLLRNDDAAVFEAVAPVAADKPLLDRHFVHRKRQGNWLLCFTSRKQRQCQDQGNGADRLVGPCL